MARRLDGHYSESTFLSKETFENRPGIYPSCLYVIGFSVAATCIEILLLAQIFNIFAMSVLLPATAVLYLMNIIYLKTMLYIIWIIRNPMKEENSQSSMNGTGSTVAGDSSNEHIIGHQIRLKRRSIMQSPRSIYDSNSDNELS